MPGGDRTGPRGFGPMTGRGMGYCARYPAPGYMHPGFGRGFGWYRFGRGRGFWRGWPAPYVYMPPVEAYPPGEASLEEERKYLEDMIRDLEREIGAIRDRIKELGPKE